MVSKWRILRFIVRTCRNSFPRNCRSVVFSQIDAFSGNRRHLLFVRLGVTGNRFCVSWNRFWVVHRVGSDQTSCGFLYFGRRARVAVVVEALDLNLRAWRRWCCCCCCSCDWRCVWNILKYTFVGKSVLLSGLYTSTSEINFKIYRKIITQIICNGRHFYWLLVSFPTMSRRRIYQHI